MRRVPSRSAGPGSILTALASALGLYRRCLPVLGTRVALIVLPYEALIGLLRRLAVPAHAALVDEVIRSRSGTVAFTVISLASIPVLYAILLLSAWRASRALAWGPERAGVWAAAPAANPGKGGRPRGWGLIPSGWTRAAAVVVLAGVLVVTVRVLIALLSDPAVHAARSITAFLAVSAAINALTAIVFTPFLAALLATLRTAPGLGGSAAVAARMS